MRHGDKVLNFGCHKNEIEAALVYDKNARRIKGAKYAFCINQVEPRLRCSRALHRAAVNFSDEAAAAEAKTKVRSQQKAPAGTHCHPPPLPPAAKPVNIKVQKKSICKPALPIRSTKQSGRVKPSTRPNRQAIWQGEAEFWAAAAAAAAAPSPNAAEVSATAAMAAGMSPALVAPVGGSLVRMRAPGRVPVGGSLVRMHVKSLCS